MFFSSMSHDMRTPLNAIIGAAELAKMHIKDMQKVQEYLEKMKYSGRVLLELINDILEISRMEQGKLSFDIQKIDLRQCLCECCDIFSAEAEANDKIFEIDMDLPDVQVYGDCFRISQIVNNLLSNAFKYTNRGDRILLSAKTLENQDSAKYLIVVEDTGIGMSEAFQEKNFFPYEREIRLGENQILGTGLGMSIVYYLVTQMGGQSRFSARKAKAANLPLSCPLPLRRIPVKSGKKKRQNRNGSI